MATGPCKPRVEGSIPFLSIPFLLAGRLPWEGDRLYTAVVAGSNPVPGTLALRSTNWSSAPTFNPHKESSMNHTASPLNTRIQQVYQEAQAVPRRIRAALRLEFLGLDPLSAAVLAAAGHGSAVVKPGAVVVYGSVRHDTVEALHELHDVEVDVDRQEDEDGEVEVVTTIRFL